MGHVELFRWDDVSGWIVGVYSQDIFLRGVEE